MDFPFVKIESQKDYSIPPDKYFNYYSKLYPFKLVINWLCRNDTKLLKNRELCLTNQKDRYIRYQSFTSAIQFRNRILKLIPIKIDVGAIYDDEPRYYNEHKQNTDLIFQEKELIFDIDMSDYDEVRTCCTGADICSKCWKYIICGAKILDRILREDFGFKKYFFDFSGRRGIHCWVCDKNACKLNTNERQMIESYILYDRINDESIKSRLKRRTQKRKFVDPIYPSYLDDLSIVKNDFYVIIKEQDLLNYENIKKLFKDIIKMYFCLIDMEAIEVILNKKIDSLKKLKKIHDFLTKAEKILNKNNITYCHSESCINEFIMSILSPRLDWMVTRQPEHLLKGPFCVHPKTGFISVPMSLDLLLKFDLNKIPKIDNLLDKDNNNDINYFNEYIQFFENFVKNLNNNDI
jgi:DNA primase small subunit